MKENEILEFYETLDPRTRVLASKLRKNYLRDSSVKNFIKHWKKVVNSDNDMKILETVAVLKSIPAYRVTEQNMNDIRCYGAGDEEIKITGVITKGKHVRLYRGQHVKTKKDVVVKWYQSGKRTTEFEMNLYKKLGKPRPCFSLSYTLWNYPVLVMEHLDQLSPDDDLYEMGIQVIKQLRKLHEFGVHCDLKPGNIMKRKRSNGTYQFIVIDYGGVATEKLEYGYRRWVWSPKWTSQKRRGEIERDIIVTAKNDFIELGYTIQTLLNEKRGITNHQSEDVDPIRTGFTGRLKKYMKQVFKIKDDEEITDHHRKVLIKILMGKVKETKSVSYHYTNKKDSYILRPSGNSPQVKKRKHKGKNKSESESNSESIVWYGL